MQPLDAVTEMVITLNGAPLVAFEATTSQLLGLIDQVPKAALAGMTPEQSATAMLIGIGTGHEPSVELIGEPFLNAFVTYLALVTEIGGERLVDRIGFDNRFAVDFTTICTANGRAALRVEARAESARRALAN